MFTLDATLRPIYEKFGIDVTGSNGDASYELPIPATYVIDQDRTIRFAFADADYT